MVGVPVWVLDKKAPYGVEKGVWKVMPQETRPLLYIQG